MAAERTEKLQYLRNLWADFDEICFADPYSRRNLAITSGFRDYKILNNPESRAWENQSGIAVPRKNTLSIYNTKRRHLAKYDDNGQRYNALTELTPPELR